MGTANATVTAKARGCSYVVVFDSNAPQGTTVIGTMDNQSGFIYGRQKALRANAYQVMGYKFVGWSESKKGKAAYTDKGKLSTLMNAPVKDGDLVVLYAVWAPVK